MLPYRLFLAGLLTLHLLAITGDATAGTSGDGPLETAWQRGLAWIEAHPASPEQGGLADMIDEAVVFFVMGNLTRSPAARDQLARSMAARAAAIEHQARFRQWVEQPGKPLLAHYHLLLAAHLMQLAGHPSAHQAAIVTQARAALASTPRAMPTIRLTIAILLRYLEGNAGSLDGTLLGASLMEGITRRAGRVNLPASATGLQARLLATRLYALVHEIAALTGFGRLPPPPWLAARSDILVRVLMDAIGWAREQREPDLVAELVLTARLLGAPRSPKLREAIEELARTQLPDGSWGPSATTTRSDKVRHPVLTATGALWAYLNWESESEPSPTATRTPLR